MVDCMKEILEALILLLTALKNWAISNSNGIIVSLVSAFIGGLIFKIWKYIKNKPKELVKLLLSPGNFNERDYGKELSNALRIDDIMRGKFPEYTDYLLIQYGSSVEVDGTLPKDYDFIVLMLGFPKEGRRYLHNKGTNPGDGTYRKNDIDVDIVFRDYLSFLYAASAGMPYENSVIANGKLIKGNLGYFQWLKNITMNLMFDRDFLIRRYKEKIIIEKQEFQKCLNEHEKYKHDKYYVIRSGYYYVTSILQLSRIQKFEKVFFRDDTISLSKVRLFYNDIDDENLKNKYMQLVECLKRNAPLENISIGDIKLLLIKVEKLVEVND